MARFSLVVPTYNVAPYLPRCLESLAALRPAADEIIAVDDGSTDDCPRILAEFAQRLPQMHVIRQENRGLSSARNIGLDHATGRWLAFVDPDDFVDPEAYATALCMAESDQLDMVLLNGDYHYEGRQPDMPIYPGIASTPVITGREWLRARLAGDRLAHMVWLHLYRREFIEANRFRFIPHLIHEDVIWTTEALLAARRVRYDSRIAIHYRLRLRTYTPEQQQRRLTAIVDSSIINARRLSVLAQHLSDDPELKRLLGAQLVDGALSIFHKLEKMPDRKIARGTLVSLRKTGFLDLLWKHASGSLQHRRLSRHWLRSWFA